MKATNIINSKENLEDKHLIKYVPRNYENKRISTLVIWNL